MDALRSYLTTAMVASVASAICIQLTDERFRKYVKYLAGLCMLLVLVHPLLGLISDMGDYSISVEESSEETLSGDSAYVGLLGNQLSEAIGDRVAYIYDLSRDAVYVTLTLDTSDLSAIEIKAIDLLITEKCDGERIAQAMSAEFACTVNVSEEIMSESTD